MNSATPLFTSFANHPEVLRITPELVVEARLQAWAQPFKLGTAGYRDLLDPEDFHNTAVPFNSLTVSVLLLARAQLAREEGITSLHVGGEVRPHTQELIDLAARIYAAHGISVHLRPDTEKTTPIWLSSFGIFYEELDGGENFTASHSQSYKGGWKPMDSSGGQLLDLAPRIADRVRQLVNQAQQSGIEIPLASADDSLVQRDFDPVSPYVEVLQQVVPSELLAEVPRAASRGFRAAFCTEGGSMAATARRVFAELDIGVDQAGPVFFTHEQESSNYHGIGIVDGVNHGVDPGKWQVYKNVGADGILRERQADIFFIWDPDGDRFNMVTTAPVGLAEEARSAGLEVEPLDDDRCLVYFKPNQIYFMLTAARIEALQGEGSLDAYDWIVATTFPTTHSIGELAEKYNARHATRLQTFLVPVGFKYFAALVRDLEGQLGLSDGGENGGTRRSDLTTVTGGEQVARVTCAADVTGHRVVFGPRPRMLIMAEESGGAAMGPSTPLHSRHGRRRALAAKEKDAMQIGVLALTLAAKLHNSADSFADYYLSLLTEFAIEYRFYERRDVTLFDELLQGDARTAAQAEGNRRKVATVEFFASLEGQEPGPVAEELRRRLPAGTQLPRIEAVFHAGDGTFITMTGQWFELRASGTDAVLRYYMEGEDPQQVTALNEAFTQLNVKPTR